MSTEIHQPSVWFREHDETMHWRCWRCGAPLPDTEALKIAYTGFGELPAELRGCPGWDKAFHERDRSVLHQLGYEVRTAWVSWARRQSDPKPAWLAPYQDLALPDQEADQQIGQHVAQFVLHSLIAWRRLELTEGLVCQRLGLDRIAWRGLCNQLGLIQEAEGC